ncbi:MAG TPA: A/G-specific adenine glycosylase [Agriterribacter sp.]|nr:A/G-specific adenine glycosylase [Agriterribacter sp.]
MTSFFTKNLLKWNKKINRRDMPWKAEKDPYKIWLSEIILQQTRVEQGWNYYLKFTNAFPTVQQLANAPETKIFKFWEGLGYYSRCKNLIAAAKVINTEYNGIFPPSYDDILALPGIGPYTASAIASFAFNQPYAVVDGNVQRVLARVFGIHTIADSTKGKALFNTLATELLDKKQPDVYNQAIMDFGAVVCKPKAPMCTQCVMQKDCIAYQSGMVEMLPIKGKKTAKKNRWLYYFIISHKNRIFIRKRTGKDIWQNLHEFFLVETQTALTKKALSQHPLISKLLKQKVGIISHVSKLQTQQLTHQTLHGQFIEIGLKKRPDLGADFIGVPYHELRHYAFPKFMITYLQEKNVNLSEQ